MLKSLVASLVLLATPSFPSLKEVPQKAPVVAPPATPEGDSPNLAQLKLLADAVAKGPITDVEKQPMHVQAILFSKRMEGKVAMIVFANADGTLTTGLLVGWKGEWMMMDGFRS